MFERFVRLAQARKALKGGRYEQAIQLAGDPLIRGHRRAEVVRAEALEGLVRRAKKRSDAGNHSAALADVSRVLAMEPEFAGIATLKRDIGEKLTLTGERAGSARELAREGRRLAEAGDLETAIEMLESARGVHEIPADLEALERLIAGRRAAACDVLVEARAARGQRQFDRACELVRRARGMDRRVEGLEREAKTLAEAVAKDLLPRLRAVQKESGPTAAMAMLIREQDALPELAITPRLDAFHKQLSGDKRQELLAPLADGDVETAIEMYESLDARARREESIASLEDAFGDLKTAVAQRDRGNFGVAEQALRDAAKRLDLSALLREAKSINRTADRTDASLAKAREFSAHGQLTEAREVLLTILAEFPLHEGARREMEIVDQGAQDKEQRLADARRLAKQGCLKEASALVVALAVPGSQGDEARLLLRDVQQRMDLVDTGLQQVMRALHGRDSATRDGLLHCVRRLEELEKIQCDHEELTALKNAAESEIAGLNRLDAAGRALAEIRPRELGAALSELKELQRSFLKPDRLDAKLMELGDEVFAVADSALDSGGLTRAESWLDAIAPLTAGCDEIGERVQRFRTRLEARKAEAQSGAEAAREALERRDLAAAQECLERAQLASGDDPHVLRIEQAVHAVRKREDGIADVEALASRKDFVGAQRKLDELGPTPGLLRTRIFDLKKDIAKKQGLGEVFLLRVDEGGEFVVARSDSVTVGNLRDGTADLTLLANLAGCHARIQRKMSFHGGMQDMIRADRGAVSIDGRPVSEHRLRHGMRVRLGPSVELEYVLPSQRSLTALLVVRGGFQVAGTDKILLMKDRGRDGRILIGPSRDAHVAVSGASVEVELFAGKDGQIRVRCEGGGQIDGRPFQGEHPVAAGAVVECRGVTFVLQPWNKT